MTTRMVRMLSFGGLIFTACTYALPKVDDSTGCGNGIVEEDELCDDGNKIDGDGCDSTCLPSSKCGDGMKSGIEECDDGNEINGDDCDSNCTVPACGNGIPTNGELCDDGNLNNEDDCTNSCIPGICGDGIPKKVEECDDGNTVAGDECDPNCTKPRCGNGIIAPGEFCDDGNTVGGDDCNVNCSFTGISTLFVGKPGEAAVVDGVGDAARLRDGHYMALWGDTIYLANDQTVRAIDIPTKTVTTIAGLDGAADHVNAMNGSDARFRDLRGITTDGTTIWVSDVGNHVIRSITIKPPYTVNTVAGNPDSTTAAVPIVDGGPGMSRLDSPRGLAHVGGQVYFVEANASVLRVLNPTTQVVTTLAGMNLTPGTQDGTGMEARFYGPRHIISNGASLLYIADTTGFKVRTYDIGSNYVGTIAGTSMCGYTSGNATTSKLFSPRGLALDGQNLFFAESDANTIRQLELKTLNLSTLTGIPDSCTADCSCMTAPAGDYVEGSPKQALWSNPYDMVFHPGTHSLFVSDGNNHVIRQIQ